MFLPAGFLATEHCKRGVLVYGIRKALLYTSQEAAESYNVVINLHEASKNPWASRKRQLGLWDLSRRRKASL